nr:phage adsorption protein NrfB [Legionella jordanis]
MESTYVIVVFLVMWYFLIFLALLFIASGVDDLFFDFYYWIRYLIRKWQSRSFKPLTYEKLVSIDEKYIAVLIPCWHEDGVIGTMLKHNCYSIEYTKYVLFVGVYPNDPQTVAEVRDVEALISNVHCVIGEHSGPTNKAANLNGIYTYVKQFEEKQGMQFDIFVFHDSEDVIHPLSFKLYNFLIPRKDMIQIPVFPLEVNHWNFTHWLYADEFSEIHTKDIIVREAIRGHVPSAGVGTAFSRSALKAIENPTTHQPFSTDSLTEDYHTSLAIRLEGLKQIFVTQTIIRMKWQRRGLIRKRYVLKKTKEYIATRALFPMEYKKAVRQKARWIIGIVFQEWLHSKWPKSWKVKYTLAHDRKSFIAHFINGFGYFVLIFWLIYGLFTYSKPEYPSLQEQLNLHPWVWGLIIAVTFLMLQRMLQRFIAVYRVYGVIPAILSIPRTPYGNLLNLHAILRAYRVYFSTLGDSKTPSKQPGWDKTEHQYPGSHILISYRRRLGDLLLQNNFISAEQLEKAILEQRKTGERLGRVLEKLHYIDEKFLTDVLAKQYNLELFPKSQIPPKPEDFSSKDYKWLIEQNAFVISFEPQKKIIKIGIEDPTNEFLIENIILRFQSFNLQFVLLDSSR